MTTQFLISSFIVLQFGSTCHTHTHSLCLFPHIHLRISQIHTLSLTHTITLTLTHTSTRIRFQSLLFLSLLKVDAHLQLLRRLSKIKIGRSTFFSEIFLMKYNSSEANPTKRFAIDNEYVFVITIIISYQLALYR